MIPTTMWLLAAAVAGGAALSPQTRAGTPAVAHKDGVDGLEAYVAASAEACTSKAFAKGKAIALALLPGRGDLAKALKDGVPPSLIEKILATYARLPSTADEQMACLLTPGEGRTEIKAHAATTEAIRACAPGTPAFEEFPGGARTIAEQILRPGVTFYEVEVTRPGQPDGMKYHMFFWNGSEWRMLGPVWRALQ